MYVVGARDGQCINGQIANAAMQVCADPPAVAVCINKKNLTHEIIEKGGSFTVSAL
jgi:ferric-chelate reductase [NAD(P)H]